MASAPSAGRAFFPLDDLLGLLPGSLTPRAQQRLVLLGTVVPSFDRAATLLSRLTGVQASAPTVRRLTEGAGAAAQAVHEQQRVALEAEAPLPPPGAARACVSVDGVFVPLVGGGAREVKTLAIGTPTAPQRREGVAEAVCTSLTYYASSAEAEPFAQAATVELHRRGLEGAEAVAAVVDGAEWCQGFIDYHCPTAVRILDFAHVAERLNECSQMLFGEGSLAAQEWLAAQLHTLKHEGPEAVLAELAQRSALVGSLASPSQAGRLREHRQYLVKRVEQLRYPQYRAAGWPIGSGSVESAHKQVVQARLDGPGMHWAVAHLEPMLSLRNAHCNERWEETWTLVERRLREQVREAASKRRAGRRVPLAPPGEPVGTAAKEPRQRRGSGSERRARSQPKPPVGAGSKPAPRPHPWRRFNPGWLSSPAHAKL